jgi:hypothetical protein
VQASGGGAKRHLATCLRQHGALSVARDQIGWHAALPLPPSSKS